jgi:hypothetical protein
MDDEKEQIDLELAYKARFHLILLNLAAVSDILRSVKTFAVAMPAFCDIIMMYASSESYFT